MLGRDEFIKKFCVDIGREFEEVFLDNYIIKVGKAENGLEVNVDKIYYDYNCIRDYNEILESNIKIFKKVLDTYRYKINYDDVLPIIKLKDFGSNADVEFISESLGLNTDLSIFYVQDMGEMFRFITETDASDYDKLRRYAMYNINKMTNKIEKLDPAVSIYSFRFATDNNASLILNDSIKKQLEKRLGKIYYFMLISENTALFSAPIPTYIPVLKNLSLIDANPHKISDKVYICDNGEYRNLELE